MKRLTKGSKCVVYLLSDDNEILKTSGTFLGFVTLGEDTALMIELDESHKEMKEKIRIIPSSSVAAVDVITLEVEEEEAEKEKTSYFI